MSENSSPLEQAQEQGYIGNVAEEPPNEAYTVQGQGADTVEAERQALRKRRDEEHDASREQESSQEGEQA